MNKIILLGRLVRDPEVRVTPTERTVCTFTLSGPDESTDRRVIKMETAAIFFLEAMALSKRWED